MSMPLAWRAPRRGPNLVELPLLHIGEDVAELVLYRKVEFTCPDHGRWYEFQRSDLPGMKPGTRPVPVVGCPGCVVEKSAGSELQPAEVPTG